MYLRETEFNDLEKIWIHCDKKVLFRTFFIILFKFWHKAFYKGSLTTSFNVKKAKD